MKTINIGKKSFLYPIPMIKKIALVFGIVILTGLSMLFILDSGKNYEKIYSEILDETRPFLVHLPEGYENSTKRYPVLYMLDGGDRKVHSKDIPRYSQAVSTLKQLDYTKIPEMILIGVANTDRQRDMLPVKIDLFASGGGADKFLKFLEDELIPYVNRNYRTIPLRILYGMSDSGLFSVYALLTSPDSFSGYIASSPSLGYCPGLIHQKAEKLFEKKEPVRKLLYITYCSKDTPFCNTAVPPFEEKIIKMQSKGFRLGVKVVEGKCHIPETGLKDGLGFIFHHLGAYNEK